MSPFSLTAEQVALLMDEVPALAARPRTVRDLPGGLTNRNLHVTTPDGEFVVRCSDEQADALGIDRQAEYSNSVAAEMAGVGARVIGFRPDLHLLVIGFIEGRTLTRADFATPGLLPRVATALRILHAGPRFIGDFDMFERQRSYLETVRRGGYRLPSRYLEVGERLGEIRRALDDLDGGTVPCNNDLLAENFVDDGSKIWIIDYEYAGNNDACFELGNVWAECRLSIDQLDELVTSYYGAPRPSKVARARLLGAVGQYGWTLWGAIQNAVSPLDFDYWGWALERFDIAERELSGPDLDRLLRDVQTPDRAIETS